MVFHHRSIDGVNCTTSVSIHFLSRFSLFWHFWTLGVIFWAVISLFVLLFSSFLCNRKFVAIWGAFQALIWGEIALSLKVGVTHTRLFSFFLRNYFRSVYETQDTHTPRRGGGWVEDGELRNWCSLKLATSGLLINHNKFDLVLHARSDFWAFYQTFQTFPKFSG